MSALSPSAPSPTPNQPEDLSHTSTHPSDGCPICHGEIRLSRKLYETRVCNKCSADFAGRRQLAFIIDVSLAFIVVSGLAFAASVLSQISGGSGSWATGTLVMVGFFLLVAWKDAFSGRSLGKRLMGITVIDSLTGLPAGEKASMARNFLLGIPYVNLVGLACWFQLMEGSRMGDSWARTKVIWDKYADHPVFAVTPPGVSRPAATSRGNLPIWALAALICGIVSIPCCALLFGLVATPASVQTDSLLQQLTQQAQVAKAPSPDDKIDEAQKTFISGFIAAKCDTNRLDRRPFYAQRVDYYGKEMTPDQLLQNDQAFFKKWPNRHYTPKDRIFHYSALPNGGLQATFTLMASDSGSDTSKPQQSEVEILLRPRGVAFEIYSERLLSRF